MEYKVSRVVVKLENVSVKSGKKFRHNQNYSLVLQSQGIDEHTTVDDIRKLITDTMDNVVRLSDNSKITIIE